MQQILKQITKGFSMKKEKHEEVFFNRAKKECTEKQTCENCD
jgi:hypothetical protein